jgi:peptidoglycan/xylan/chitin deacetylase (PgdA/CDA1 family)
MQAGGIEFGSHTATHPILTRIAPDRLQREVSGSRAELEARLGSPVAAFCYPNGDYDARVLRAVRTAGYRLACTTREFPNDATTDRLELNRLPVGPRSGRGWRGVFSGPAFTADLLDMFKRRAGGRAASNRPGSG